MRMIRDFGIFTVRDSSTHFGFVNKRAILRVASM